MHSIGTIKWFGGTNATTGRSNDYGFVTDIGGEDAFLHARRWEGASPPAEGEVIVYALEEGEKGWRAIDAAPAESISLSLASASDLVDRWEPFRARASRGDGITPHVRRMAREALLEADQSEIELLLRLTTRSARLLTLLAGGEAWEEDLASLVARAALNPFETVPWHLLPDAYFANEERQLAEYLASLDPADASRLVQDALERFSIPFLVYLASIGLIGPSPGLGARAGSVHDYIERVVFDGEIVDSEHLAAHVSARLGHYHDLEASDVLAPSMHLARFKRLLFEKDPAFAALQQSSPYLGTRFDCFILSTLFEAVIAGNDLGTVYRTFDRKLWEVMASGQHDLRADDTRALLLELMPSCGSANIGPGLSCEAFFWKTDDGRGTEDIFLCRGRRCRTPKVLPVPERTWRDFTLYDWFAHYGIAYTDDERPARRDFPIKLAGYLNRVVELVERLDCRCCGTRMLPDWRYARTGRWVMHESGPVWEEHQAAYRTTMFHCLNDECRLRGEKFYINHCLGFRCHCFIDSRDLTERCDRGRYICSSCKGCCEQHAPSPGERTSPPPDAFDEASRRLRAVRGGRHGARERRSRAAKSNP